MKPKKPAAPDRKIQDMQQRQTAAGVQLAELQAQIELALQTFATGAGSQKESAGAQASASSST
jgi:hypothetical protein